MKRVFDSHFLMGSYFLSQLLIVKEVPSWVGALCMLLILVRAYFEFSLGRQPPRWITSAFSVAFAMTVFLLYGSLVDLEAAVVFLSGMAAFKILEYQNDRDHRFLLLSSFFLVPISLLMNFELWYFPIVVISFFLLWCAVLLPTGVSLLKSRILMVAAILGVSLPVTLALFFIFPRLDGAYWGWGRWQERSQSGFSGEHKPSEISELELSDKTAFRVSFSRKLESKDLYFRGETVSIPTGIDWSRGKAKRDVVVGERDPIDQTIFLEMSGNDWLFTLDYPRRVRSDRSVQLVGNGVTRVLDFPKGSIRYEVSSSLGTDVRPGLVEDYLALPPLSEKFMELSKKLRDPKLSVNQQVQKISQFYLEDGFVYSLKPGLLRTLDDFLFGVKKGFCDHYSSATAVLLRSMGIPARLVLGYQGGEWVDFGSYLRVAQKDAHSWLEYVDNDGYWRRADPLDGTVAIPVDQSLDLLPSVLSRTGANNSPSQEWKKWRIQVSNFGDWLNFRWTMFWLDYNWDTQRALFSEYKLVFLWVFVLFLGLFISREVVRALRVSGVKLLQRQRHPATRMCEIYRRKLAALGYEIQQSSATGEILLRLNAQDRKLGAEAEKFFQFYENSIFGARSFSPETQKSMTALLRSLNRRTRRHYLERLFFFLPPLVSKK